MLKRKTAAMVEFLDRFDEAQVAFLDQIEERDAARHEALGDADDEARVGLNEVIARGNAITHHFLPAGRAWRFWVALPVAFGGQPRIAPPRERDFFLHRQERYAGHLFQIHTNDIVGGAGSEFFEVFQLFFIQLRLFFDVFAFERIAKFVTFVDC